MNQLRRTQEPVPERVDVRLVTIAAEHIRRSGVRRVTVVGIAEEAGMTHANVYRYFPSKEALIDAVVADALKPVELMMADIAGAPDPADDKLERLTLALAHAYRDLADRDRAIFALYADIAAQNRSVARRHRGRVFMFVERVVDEGAAIGIFRLRDREVAMSFLADIFFRFSHPSAILLDLARPREVMEQRFSMLISVALRTLINGFV
ncbi:TetR/AcrR family transcriptional regulator [Pseudochelatococcus contaminans]|uniref:AcrR family transcriptional regulator n=1 Tax=Pseudochelatococcus contaminans TaxID=1538103 RepID=A0A7W6EGT9_9HYPH|nr:TetR/AcrR family transcriptional regulator [Pseudochelatococcus contaminans]MBB3809257.1 AcrR family transcriptional regulator [Pseudochelatococcus contaminans]